MKSVLNLKTFNLIIILASVGVISSATTAAIIMSQQSNSAEIKKPEDTIEDINQRVKEPLAIIKTNQTKTKTESNTTKQDTTASNKTSSNEPSTQGSVTKPATNTNNAKPATNITAQQQNNAPTVCRYDYAIQAIGIRQTTGIELERELSTWEGLTLNIFNQIMDHGSFYSPVYPEYLGIDMGDEGGMYRYTDGLVGSASGYTFTADPKTMTVGWGLRSEHHVDIKNAARYQLNAMTEKMTIYLRELNTKFRAKCSSFISTLPQ